MYQPCRPGNMRLDDSFFIAPSNIPFCLLINIDRIMMYKRDCLITLFVSKIISPVLTINGQTSNVCILGATIDNSSRTTKKIVLKIDLT